MEKTQKNCLFKNIAIIKLVTKATLFPNFNHMGGGANKTIIATAFFVVIAITLPVNANASNNPKQDKIICEIKSICQQLSKSIQAQIDELEKSDNPNFDKLDELQIELIAVENQKQTNFDKKSEENQATIDAIDETDQKIAELRGVLLEK